MRIVPKCLNEMTMMLLMLYLAIHAECCGWNARLSMTPDDYCLFAQSVVVDLGTVPQMLSHTSQHTSQTVSIKNCSSGRTSRRRKLAHHFLPRRPMLVGSTKRSALDCKPELIRHATWSGKGLLPVAFKASNLAQWSSATLPKYRRNRT